MNAGVVPRLCATVVVCAPRLAHEAGIVTVAVPVWKISNPSIFWYPVVPIMFLSYGAIASVLAISDWLIVKY